MRTKDFTNHLKLNAMVLIGFLFLIVQGSYGQNYDSLQLRILNLEMNQKELQLKLEAMHTEKKQVRPSFNGIKIIGGLTTATYFVLQSKHNNQVKSGNTGSKPPSPIVGAVGCLILTIGFAY